MHNKNVCGKETLTGTHPQKIRQQRGFRSNVGIAVSSDGAQNMNFHIHRCVPAPLFTRSARKWVLQKLCVICERAHAILGCQRTERSQKLFAQFEVKYGGHECFLHGFYFFFLAQLEDKAHNRHKHKTRIYDFVDERVSAGENYSVWRSRLFIDSNPLIYTTGRACGGFDLLPAANLFECMFAKQANE